jgi:hypothetical protein
MSRTMLAGAAVWLVLDAGLHAGEPMPADYVYTVVVQKTDQPPRGALQTGFRLQGTKGIITALHGVAGANSISAWTDRRKEYTGLVIADVDVPNDLALLRNEALSTEPAVGLVPGTDERLVAGEGLVALGHPLGISLNEKPVAIGSPPLEPLRNLVPPSAASSFLRRNSPAPSIEIIYLSVGNLVPGHSGAPLLTAHKKVVGIIDGGLLGGVAGISWAVPLSHIAWLGGNGSGDRIPGLAAQGVSNLFAMDNAAPQYLDGIAPCKRTSLTMVPFTCASGNLEFEVKWAQFTDRGEQIPSERFTFVPLESGFRLEGPFSIQGHAFGQISLGRVGLNLASMDGSIIGRTRIVANQVVSSKTFSEAVSGKKVIAGPMLAASVGLLDEGGANATFYAPVPGPASPNGSSGAPGTISVPGPVYVLWDLRLGGLVYQPDDQVSISVASIDFVVDGS